MSSNRNILIVINPAAGKSSYSKRLDYLADRLAKADLNSKKFFTEHGDKGKLKSFLQEDASIDEVFVMGGDGTLNYVVKEVHSLDMPIAIVSNGTGNDSVKSLHGELDFKKQVEIAINGKLNSFDLGICNDRYFVNGVGIGFDGEVVKEMIRKGNKQGRHIDYLVTALKILAGFKEKNVHFSLDKNRFERKILLMTISNGTTFGGGFIINPFAKPDDGRLDICLINEISPIRRFKHVSKLKTGKHYKIKETEFHLAAHILIEETKELVAHLDGEYIGNPPYEISIKQKALKVRTPG